MNSHTSYRAIFQFSEKKIFLEHFSCKIIMSTPTLVFRRDFRAYLCKIWKSALYDVGDGFKFQNKTGLKCVTFLLFPNSFPKKSPFLPIFDYFLSIKCILNFFSKKKLEFLCSCIGNQSYNSMKCPEILISSIGGESPLK